MTEPATLITDYLLAAVSLWLGLDILRRDRADRLRRDRADRQKSRQLWAWALLGLALSAFVGGTYHGFATAMGERAAAILWKATVQLVGIVDLLMLCGSLAAALPRRRRTPAMAAAVAKFLVYAVFMTGHDEFRFVVFDYAISMVVILLVHAVPGSLRNEAGARFILTGILLSFIAAGVQFFRIAPHPRFNHNDLYHVIQIGATWVLYRGARDLRDR